MPLNPMKFHTKSHGTPMEPPHGARHLELPVSPPVSPPMLMDAPATAWRCGKAHGARPTFNSNDVLPCSIYHSMIASLVVNQLIKLVGTIDVIWRIQCFVSGSSPWLVSPLTRLIPWKKKGYNPTCDSTKWDDPPRPRHDVNAPPQK